MDRHGEETMTHQHNPKDWHKNIWKYFPIDYSPDGYHELTKHWLDKIPALGDKIMDVGCHTGLALIWLKLNYPEKDITGIDINQTVVHFARTRVFLFQKDIPIYWGDGFNLSAYADKSKDVIFHTGLLEHFSEQERIQMLKEQLRVAKYVLFTVPTDKALEEEGGYGDEIKFSFSGWESLIKNNFLVREIFGDEKEFACVLEGVKE